VEIFWRTVSTSWRCARIHLIDQFASARRKESFDSLSSPSLQLKSQTPLAVLIRESFGDDHWHHVRLKESTRGQQVALYV
jgi:hypothetical protein